MKIVNEEACTGADERETEHGDVAAAVHQRADGQCRSADAADAGCQAVESVDEVDGVDDGNDPDHAHGHSENMQRHHGGVAEHARDKFDADAAEGHDAGCDDLPEELELRRHIGDVINNADKDQHGRAEEKSHQRLGKRIEGEGHHPKRAVDRQPAHARHDLMMHLACVWFIYCADVHSQQLHDRHEKCRQDKSTDCYQQELLSHIITSIYNDIALFYCKERHREFQA